jgi:26S proteasome regulatory subunit N9
MLFVNSEALFDEPREESTYRLPPDQRRIPIATVAARTQLDADGVEFLLMRAMSLKLVSGSIDSIDQTCNITHVAPRVLTPTELNGLKGHLKTWVGKVEGAAALLSSEGVSAIEAFA